MAIKGYFLDNEKYFAEDVNRAFSNVAPCPSFTEIGSISSNAPSRITPINPKMMIRKEDSLFLMNCMTMSFLPSGYCSHIVQSVFLRWC